MSNSIEILQNTLLKLIVRQGPDSDRKLILLDTGELGYSTDNDRLFIGNGVDMGGLIVGNKYLGEGNPVTFPEAEIGDLVFNNSGNKLYKFSGTNYANLANWKVVGSVLTAGNSINIDESSNIISLSGGGIKTNAVSTYDSEYLKLPSKTTINSVDYNWPSGGLQQNMFLSTDIYGNLKWNTPIALNSFYVSGSSSRIPVGMITPFVSGGSVPYGWLLCNGQEVEGSDYPELSAAIKTTYGGSGSKFKVPNLTNKTLYGVVTNPATSTTYAIASGNNSSLSAIGTNFVIKAIGDHIITSTLAFRESLSATLNGVAIPANAQTTTLSGNISIGLPAIISSQNVTTTFNIDQYGRVIEVIPDRYPGQVLTDSNDVEIVNPSGYIKFLKTPVNVWNFNRNTYEKRAIITNGILPPYAKTAIIETAIFPGRLYNKALICAAPNISLLYPITNEYTIGPNELIVNQIQGGYKSSIWSINQTMVPLSSNGETSSFALRLILNYWTSTSGYVRIVGYTL